MNNIIFTYEVRYETIQIGTEWLSDVFFAPKKQGDIGFIVGPTRCLTIIIKFTASDNAFLAF